MPLEKLNSAWPSLPTLYTHILAIIIVVHRCKESCSRCRNVCLESECILRKIDGQEIPNNQRRPIHFWTESRVQKTNRLKRAKKTKNRQAGLSKATKQSVKRIELGQITGAGTHV